MALDDKIINLDINKLNILNLNAKQYDTTGARSFTFRLLKDNQAFDLTNLTVRVGGTKSDGSTIFDDCTVIDAKKGLVQLSLTTQMQTVAGILEAELIIMQDMTRLSTVPFSINIIKSVTNFAGIVSSDELKALTNALYKTDLANNRIDNLAKLKEGSTTGDAELIDARVATDGTKYASLSEHIRNVEKGNSLLNDSIESNKLKTVDLDTEYYSWDNLNNNADATGNWTNSTIHDEGYVKNIRFRVNGTDKKTGKIYILQCLNDGYVQLFKEYDVTDAVGDSVIVINEYIPFKFIISCKLENLAYGTVQGLKSNALFISQDKFKPTFDKDYYFAVGAEYDGIKKRLNDVEIKVLETSMQPLKLLPMHNIPKQKIIIDFINNKIKISDVYFNYQNKKDFKVCFNLINEELDLQQLPDEGYYTIYMFYNIYSKMVNVKYLNSESLNEAFKLELGDYFVTGGLAVKDKNTGIFEFTFLDGKNADLVKVITPNRIFTTDIVKNKWYDKNYCALGDSITEGENSLNGYKPMIGQRYSDLAQLEFGFKTATNLGKGGSRITRHTQGGNPKYGMVDRISDIPADTDLLCIFGGTNDFGGDVEIGSVDDEDYTHFKFALDQIIKTCKTYYPTLKIYCITPPHRNDIHPENVKNGAGYVLKDYIDAIIEICELNSIPVLDLYRTLGLTPFNQKIKETLMPDGLHPIPQGMAILADKNNNFIRNL